MRAVGFRVHDPMRAQIAGVPLKSAPLKLPGNSAASIFSVANKHPRA